MLAAADPVVTSDGRRLRFEVFSVCSGVYARLDLNERGLDGDWISKGTTNVDFNPPMRSALSSLMNSDQVSLRVGADRVEIEHGEHAVVEKQVKLPVRWLKSFVEVQVYQSKLKPQMEVPALELAKVLRTLPQQNILQAGTITYLTPQDRGVRLSQRESAAAVPIGAISRLKALEPIMKHVGAVRVHSSPHAITAFELPFEDGSFHFVMSPNAARGFSGEGQALSELAQKLGTEALARVRSALVWQEKLDPAKLSADLGLPEEEITAALQVLGTRGLVGFDLAEQAFFHRELPFDLELVEELHPRMQKAREIVHDSGVRLSRKNGGEIEAYIKGSQGDHYVQITADNFRCTCDWFAKHQGERGPCSHVLAAELCAQAEEEK